MSSAKEIATQIDLLSNIRKKANPEGIEHESKISEANNPRWNLGSNGVHDKTSFFIPYSLSNIGTPFAAVLIPLFKI